MEYSRNFFGENTRNSRRLWGEASSLARTPNDVVTGLSKVLNNGSVSGAVVSGPSGSGRRSSVEAAYSQLTQPSRLVRLNGSSFGQKMPMGVLAFLLAQLDTSQQPSRHELIHGLARSLCPDGVPSVVLLGNPELVDEVSGSLLAQLAAMRKIKLIVICEEIQELPRDILALFRSGQLDHFSINRMNTLEARAFLETELKGSFSPLAASTLQILTNSSRNMMLNLARIWISQHQLVQVSGIWVLRTAELGKGPAIQTMFASIIAGLEDEQLVLLNTLAHSGAVSMDKIHRGNLSEQMDILMSTGHVGAIPHMDSRVGIRTPLLTLMLRQNQDSELHDRCVEMAAILHDDVDTAETLTSMLAYGLLHNYEEVIRTGELFARYGYTADKWLTAPFRRSHILGCHVRALIHADFFNEASQLLQEAQLGLVSAMEQTWSQGRLLRANQEIEMLGRSLRSCLDEVEVQSTVFVDSVPTTSASSWMTTGLQLRSLALQAIEWSKTDRQADAQTLVNHITLELRTQRFSSIQEGIICSEELGEIEDLLLKCDLLSGNYSSAMVRATELAVGKYANAALIARAEMLRGVLFALQCDQERALEILEPCLHQLNQQSNAIEKAATVAVITYSLVSSGRISEARSHLLREPVKSSDSMSDAFLGFVAEVFASLSLATIDSIQVGQERILSFARHAQHCGHHFLEAKSLGYALKLGDRSISPRLHRVASVCQGSIAGNYAKLALSVGSDPIAMSSSLQNLIKAGHVLIASGPDNAFLSELRAKEQRKLAKLVATQKRPVFRALEEHENEHENNDNTVPEWASELTKRESQIALLAISGKTNLEIARYKGVSIRTVEGHLYQVYSKLQVRNRQELTALDRTSRRAASKL